MPLIAIVTFVAMYPLVHAKWINWDDPGYVHANRFVKSLSWANLKGMFSSEGMFLGNYHPITVLSLAIDYQFAELDPARYHIVNLLIHVLNTALVFVFIRMLSGNKVLVAAFVAMFFGIHPMHVESVAWIAERKDVLYTFFFFLALIAYLRYSQTMNLCWLALTFALFYVSVLSKAVAVVLPVVLFLIDYYRGRPLFTPRCIGEKIPFFAVSIYYGLVAMSLQTIAMGDLAAVSIPQRFCLGWYAMWTYCWKFFIPVNFSILHPYPLTDEQGRWFDSFYLQSFTGLAIAIITLMYVWWRRDKIVGFGAGFFFVTIALVLQFLSVGIAIVAERYSYVPYVGLWFIVGMKVQKWMHGRTTWQAVVGAFTCVVAIVFAIQTYVRCIAWHDSGTIWSDAIDQYPYPKYRVEVAYQNRGNFLAQEQGRLDEGLQDYRTLELMQTKEFAVYSYMGTAYAMKARNTLKQGNAAQARELFMKSDQALTKALALYDKDASTYMNRAITRMALKQYDSAFEDFAKAAETEPGNLEIYRNRAMAYNEDGVARYDLAIKDFDRIIAAEPNNISILMLRGIAQIHLGNAHEAIADFEAIRKIDPKNGEANARIAGLYFDQGDYASANEYSQRAVQIGYPIDSNFLKTLAERLNGPPGAP